MTSSYIINLIPFFCFYEEGKKIDTYTIGDLYEIQPKKFYRPLIGRCLKVEKQHIWFEIENYQLCDKQNVEKCKGRIVADVLDIKRALKQEYFFS